MNPFWSQIARELLPYVPGEQPRLANLVRWTAGCEDYRREAGSIVMANPNAPTRLSGLV